MRIENFHDLTVTRHGRFNARLTQITLDRLRLMTVEESVPRIAFVEVPKDKTLISFSFSARAPQTLGGIRATIDAIVTVGPGVSVYARTEDASRWGGIWFPMQELMRYSQAVMGRALTIPCAVCLWRPAASIRRLVRQIQSDAVRSAQARLQAITLPEAAHGLEQQLIEVLIECLSVQPVEVDTDGRGRRQEVMLQFKNFLKTQPLVGLSIAEIHQALGVSGRLLRQCCMEQLGISPSSYLKLMQLHSARCALVRGAPGTVTVWETARSRGFGNLGRFTAAYLNLFGERPSVTLRQGPNRAVPELASRRRRRWVVPHVVLDTDQ